MDYKKREQGEGGEQNAAQYNLGVMYHMARAWM